MRSCQPPASLDGSTRVLSVLPYGISIRQKKYVPRKHGTSPHEKKICTRKCGNTPTETVHGVILCRLANRNRYSKHQGYRRFSVHHLDMIPDSQPRSCVCEIQGPWASPAGPSAVQGMLHLTRFCALSYYPAAYLLPHEDLSEAKELGPDCLAYESAQEPNLAQSFTYKKSRRAGA
jgi:hypothetical protein